MLFVLEEIVYYFSICCYKLFLFCLYKGSCFVIWKYEGDVIKCFFVKRVWSEEKIFYCFNIVFYIYFRVISLQQCLLLWKEKSNFIVILVFLMEKIRCVDERVIREISFSFFIKVFKMGCMFWLVYQYCEGVY